jgi:hypothetical protein
VNPGFDLLPFPRRPTPDRQPFGAGTIPQCSASPRHFPHVAPRLSFPIDAFHRFAAEAFAPARANFFEEYNEESPRRVGEGEVAAGAPFGERGETPEKFG